MDISQLMVRAAVAAACTGVLPFEGALAQSSVAAAEVSPQGADITESADAAPGERQPLRQVAPPAVKVTIGPENADVGAPRFALRSQVAGSGLAVSFASSPRVRSVGGAARFPSQLPVAGLLTSGFGMRYHPIHGGSRFHSGVDLAAAAGSPLTATMDGEVRMAGWAGGYGLLVVITHGGGVETRYAHLSRLNVAEGQAVKQGDVIGFVGSTGNTTGPHVHYEVRSNGTPLDPL